MKILKKGIAYGTILALGLGSVQPMVILADDTDTQAGEVTILYTNDVHSNIDKSITYSMIAAYHDQNENSLLVDAGDEIQGSVFGAFDEGETVVKLMNAAGYDYATLGNHEFDYGMQRCLDLVNAADYPYLSTNFYHINDDGTKDYVLDPYQVTEVNGKKVAIIGISTPQSLTSSTPVYFMDESRTKYIYGFDGIDDAQDLYDSVQESIDAAEEEGADYIIALGHLGVEESAGSWTSEKVIENTTGLDAFIDGHSHTTMEREDVTDKDGNDVVLTQTGNYLDHLGEMTIAADGTISTKLLNAEDLADVTPDAEVKQLEDDWKASVDEQLGQKIAYSPIDLTINDEEGNRLVRSAETNAADFVTDAYYWYLNEHEDTDVDFVLSNGGGIRTTIPAGDLTYNAIKTINPFGNKLCVIQVDGQVIKDALEFGSRFMGVSENGGYMQVAGLKYVVDTSIPNTVKVSSDGMWTGGPEEYRVKDIQVYDKDTKTYVPLDLNKTYTVSGITYILMNSGDGFAMFNGAARVKDDVCVDYLSLAEYAKAFKDTDGDGYPEITSANSPLASYEGYGINYENLRGAGRIKTADADEEETTGTEVYRLYNPNSGEHFFTPHAEERAILVKVGWRDEGIAFYASTEKSHPIYRLYNPNSGDHHYTTNAGERDTLVKVGWRDEGVAFYASAENSHPVYRLFNPNAKTGTHHFTTNEEERSIVVRAGWRDEGIAYYVADVPKKAA